MSRTTAEAIAARTCGRGQLIVLESTTYPGTTDEVVQPILEAGGLRCGRDFFLAFSPEREDPGNLDFETATHPQGRRRRRAGRRCARAGALRASSSCDGRAGVLAPRRPRR